MIRLVLSIALFFVSTLASPSLGREPTHRNVVYGMYGGLALLMDVYVPTQGNGYGIILIPGSGWHNASNVFGERELKIGYDYVNTARDALIGGGFTVFVINHRSAPEFRWPAAFHDAQRAVSFVRKSAARFSIDADRIGAIGHSSGGHLAAMLGVVDGKTDDQTSTKVQAVVAIAAPHDMTVWDSIIGVTYAVSFMGQRPPNANPHDFEFVRTGIYADASPVTHVTRDDAPFFLIQGTDDNIVSGRQLRPMKTALQKAGVTVEAIEDLGGNHSPRFEQRTIVDWMRKMLDRKKVSSPRIN